jgi:hypothetical protein
MRNTLVYFFDFRRSTYLLVVLMFWIVASIGCIKNLEGEGYKIIVIGTILFIAGFVITFQESRTVQKLLLH